MCFWSTPTEHRLKLLLTISAKKELGKKVSIKNHYQKTPYKQSTGGPMMLPASDLGISTVSLPSPLRPGKIPKPSQESKQGAKGSHSRPQNWCIFPIALPKTNITPRKRAFPIGKSRLPSTILFILGRITTPKNTISPASLSFFKFSSEPDWTMPAKSVLEPKVPLPRRDKNAVLLEDQGIDLNKEMGVCGYMIICTPQKFNIKTKNGKYVKGFQTITGIHVSFRGCIYVYIYTCIFPRKD